MAEDNKIGKIPSIQRGALSLVSIPACCCRFGVNNVAVIYASMRHACKMEKNKENEETTTNNRKPRRNCNFHAQVSGTFTLLVRPQSNPKMLLLFIKSFPSCTTTMGTFFKVFFIVALTDRNDLLEGRPFPGRGEGEFRQLLRKCKLLLRSESWAAKFQRVGLVAVL